jgi:calcineurin-like phosphoesterase family protein
MSKLYFISDHHFFHSNILKFVSSYNPGQPVRVFDSVEHMNETMVQNHNNVVNDEDKVYFLGDLAIGTKALSSIMPRLKGKKRLILGNHDGSKKKDFEIYFQFFEKVMESRRMGELLVTHRPVYLGKTESHIKANVHGHIHEQNIDEDKRYFNISAERINYTPISLDAILSEYESRGISLDVKL